MLIKLAWRNIWRNRSRSLITMSAVASAVLLAVVTVSLQKGVFDNLIKDVVSLYTGYVQVHARGYWEEQTLDNSFEINDTLDRAARETSGVILAAHRLETFALASSGEKTRACLVVGIDPGAEDSLTRLTPKIQSGAMLNRDDQSALVAQGLAQKLGLGLRDTLVLLTQGYYGSTAAIKLPIAGLLRFGAPDLNERTVYLPLTVAQHWLDAPNRATSLVLGLEDPRRMPGVQREMERQLPGHYEIMNWKEMMPGITQHIESDTAGAYIMLGVLYLLISFGIFSTLLMMLAERRREFGMLLALGMHPPLIGRVVFLETIFLTLCGCIAGIALSWPIVWYLNVHPLEFGGDLAKTYEKFGFAPIFPTTLKTRIFVEQALLVSCMGVILALYPVWRVLRMKAVESMKT